MTFFKHKKLTKNTKSFEKPINTMKNNYDFY